MFFYAAWGSSGGKIKGILIPPTLPLKNIQLFFMFLFFYFERRESERDESFRLVSPTSAVAKRNQRDTCHGCEAKPPGHRNRERHQRKLTRPGPTPVPATNPRRQRGPVRQSGRCQQCSGSDARKSPPFLAARNRRRPASIRASSIGTPSRTRRLIKSINTMESLTTTPVSATKPKNVGSDCSCRPKKLRNYCWSY